MEKGVSVIVCCYNSAKRLTETLRHIVSQRVRPDITWEVIVVDNASKDNTSEVADELLSGSGIKYKIVTEDKPGLSNARAKGFAESIYEYLLYCDDDNWLSQNYLQLAFETMDSNPRMGVLGGKAEAVFENEKPYWFDTYQQNFAVGDQAPDNQAALVKMDMVYGAGCMMRKVIFEKLDKLNFSSLLSGRKGNSLISGDDNELCAMVRYMGYEVWYSRNLTFKHLMTSGRMQWGYLKKLHYGFGRMRLYLQIYRYLEAHTAPPGQGLKYPLWLDKYIHQTKELLKFLPGVLFKLNEEGNDTVLKFMALRGELFELRQLKSNYQVIYTNIIELKKRIAATK